jgi:ABC-type multidrug transport system ATPase subunit
MPVLTENEPVLELSEVVKRYGGPWPWSAPVLALDRVSMRLGSGEVVGLLGPNRCGKSTICKLAMSLIKPTSGVVRRLRQGAEAIATLERVVYVPEEPVFPSYQSGRSFLELCARLSGLESGLAARRVSGVLERCGLAERGRTRIGGYSKGMRRRLALAQGLLIEPRLVILDEPAEGIDRSGQELVQELVSGWRGAGAGVLLVTHDMGVAARLADRAILLMGGRVVSDTDSQVLMGDSRLAPRRRGGHPAARVPEAVR